MRVQTNYHVGIMVFVELHHRIFKGTFGKVDQPLRDDAYSMRDYCLDAPSEMPAGSMEWISVGPNDDDGTWWPTTINRDEEYTDWCKTRPFWGSKEKQ
jgi:hypothetical protein